MHEFHTSTGVDLRFFREGMALGLVEVKGGKRWWPVELACLFPVTAWAQFISVRHASIEIAVIADPASLDRDSFRLLRDELARTYMHTLITCVHRIVERFGFLRWHVDTDRGETHFSTRAPLHASMEAVQGVYTIVDIGGNRYELAMTQMNRRSRSLISRHL